MDRYFADQPIVITVPTTSNEVTDVGTVVSIAYAISKVAPAVAAIANDTFDPAVDSNRITVDFTASPITVPTVVQVDYTLTTATQAYTYYFNFVVMPSETLVVGENSYQSYFDAVLNAEGLAAVDSFKGATKSDQIAALRNAYQIINSLVFCDKYDEYYDLGSLDETALGEIEPEFLQALKYAQVIEANEMLDVNSIHYKRLDGLMSETIGESSMMFRPGNVNNYPISRRSMMFLRNYILIRAKLGRA